MKLRNVICLLSFFIYSLTSSAATLEITQPLDNQHSPTFIKSEQTNITISGDVIYTPSLEENKLGKVFCNNQEASFTSDRDVALDTKAKEWAVSIPLTLEGINEIKCVYKKGIYSHQRNTRVEWSGPDKNVDIQARLSSPSSFLYEFKVHSNTGFLLHDIAWTFSDESIGQGNNYFKQFPSAGSYAITMTAKDSANNPISVTKTITVPVIAPKPDFEIIIIGSSETSNTYNVDLRAAALSSISSGEITQYSWDLGDGTNKTGASVTHLYSNPGNYTVSLTCLSNNNVSRTISKNLTIIEPLPPEASFSYTLSPNRTVIVDGTTSMDPEKNSLSYEWDFGDGTGWRSGFGSNVMYGFSEGGIYEVKLRVTNSLGFQHVVAQSIDVGPISPPAEIQITHQYYARGDRAEIQFQTQATLPNNGYIINWEWDFGDGSPVRTGYLPQTYHEYLAGTYEVTISLTDNHNNITTITKTITIYPDYSWPWVQFESFADNYMLTVKDPSLFIKMQVDDASPTTTTIFHNGVPVTTFSTPANSFSLIYEPEVILNEGPNFIEIRTRDIAGNEFYIQRYRTLDSTPPQLLALSPVDGSVITDIDNLRLVGETNEPLSAAYFNDELIELANDNKSFNIPLVYRVGSNSYDLKLVDTLGNEVTLTHSNNVVISLINKGLISITPHLDGESIVVSGLPGSVREGSTIEISGGFFNSVDITPNMDGSWSGIIDFAEEVEISAYNAELEHTETVVLAHNVDTTLSGIVKDPSDNPLPGVTVTILSSGQAATTNAAGVFSISKPALGDQDIKIDGTTIPQQITNGLMEFSSVNMKVSVGNKQQNVIERTIYISPKLTDGTETQISATTPTQVTSTHAPGVMIDIPAGKAVFPGGALSGTINIVNIPAEKTSVEMPDGIKPETVFALEPSGLKFKEPVDLVLPNDNDFPEGIELVILSKNSITGLWEIDGSATVTSSGNIETKPGQGITHFSEVFAAPFGLKMTAMGDKDSPGISNNIGNLTTKIELPSYKRFGESITPTLIYKSNWASPNLTISNIFNLPRQEYVRSESSGGNLLGLVQQHATNIVTKWITPDSIDTQLFIGEHTSGKLTFAADKAPEKAVVTYGVDLSQLDSGVYPAISNYEIKYRHLTISTTKHKERKLFGAGKTKVTSQVEENILESIFPPELRTIVYHQNKVNSEFGNGWKLSLNQKIINPLESRIMLENEDGSISPYVLQTTVENIASDENGIESITYSNGKLLYADQNGNIYSKASSSSPKVLLSQTQNYIGSLGVNSVKVQSQGTYCCKSGFSGCTKRCPKYFNLCEKSTYSFNLPKKIHNIIESSNDDFMFLDQQGAIWQKGVSESVVAGLVDNIGRVESSNGEINSGCQNIIQQDCNLANRTSYQTISYATEGYLPALSQCGAMVSSSGYFPVQGYSAAGLSSSKFNKPSSMILSGNGNTLIVADTGNNVVRKVFLNSNSTAIIVGNQQTYDNGDGGQALSASLYHPKGLALDSLGNLYISTERGFIRKVDTSGVIRTIAGKPLAQGGAIVENGPMENFNLNSPTSLALDEENGYLYVADTGNHRIVQLDLIDGVARAVAGNGSCIINSPIQNGIAALEMNICSPTEIALDAEKNLSYVDKTNKRVNKIIFSLGNSGTQSYASTNRDHSVLNRKADGTFERILRDGTKTVFNSRGLHVSSQNLAGNSVSFVYDSNDRLSSYTDVSGSTLTLSYSGSRLTQITDPAQRSTTFLYNGDGNLVEVRYPDNSFKTYTYDANNLLIQETNQRGYATTYNFNDLKKLYSVVTSDNQTVELQDSTSKTYYDSFDGGSRKLVNYTEAQQEGITDSIKSAKGEVTTFVKETNGYVSKIIDSSDQETVIQRDSEGRPVKITKPDGTFIDQVYSDKGDLLSKYESVTNTTESFTYNVRGQVTSHTSPTGKITSNQYDAVTGLLIKEIDHRGVFLQNTYNQDGLIASSVNSLGQINSYTYNAQGNLSKSKSPMGEEVIYNSDDAGNVISVISAKNETTTYSYDQFNRILVVSTSGGQTASYTYLPTGEITQIVDGNNNTTSFEYNSVGKAIKKISPMGQITQWSYDQNGNITQKIDPMGQVFNFEYNDSNQLIKKTMPGNEYNYTYSDSGNPLSIENLNSSFEFSYTGIHGAELLTGLTEVIDDVPTNTINYTYNPDGRLVGMSSSYMNLNYAFNDSGKIQQLSNSLGQTFTYSYDSANRLTSINRNGVIITEQSYDANSFLTSIFHRKSGVAVSSFAYTRDADSYRSSLTTLHGTHNYQYNNGGQLVGASHPEADSLHSLETFTYDTLGNRTADNQGSFTYDNKKFRLLQDWKYIYAYDLNGNLITKQELGLTGNVQNFVYSSENKLIQIDFSSNGVLVKQVFYSYDALGRRVKKRIVENQTEVIRKYVYDSNEIIAELNGDNQVLVKYTHSGIGTDDVLAMNITPAGVSEGIATSSGNYLFLKDALGSIIEITNSSGEIVQHYVYSSYGKLLEIQNNGINKTSNPDFKIPFSYTNREYDSESGLYYYRARYYDSFSGRFLQEDPDPGSLESPITMSTKYGYVGMNPINAIDPSGEFFWIPFAVAVLKTAIYSAIINVAFTGILTQDFSLNNMFNAFVTGAVEGAIYGGVGFGVAYGLGKIIKSGKTLVLVSGLVMGLIGAAAGFLEADPDAPLESKLMAALSGGISGFVAGLFAGMEASRLRNITDIKAMLRDAINSLKSLEIPSGNNGNIFKGQCYTPSGLPVTNTYNYQVIELGRCVWR